ncbi:MAG: prepilin-type N-terminal cleavage/methylation domain-containing protein [Rickettsiales bacterium]|jgi:prepilin-type N-terminal cleavage/methylation domain-containing protein
MNYKKNIKIKLGFSLLELSVVLLVTSVLMTAVIKGSDLIDMAKISAAQQKTANSPVWDIDGLQAWYETTLNESFDNREADDGVAVSSWNDISGNNPNSPNNATATLNNEPTYISGVLNGLPALRFGGVDDFLSFTNTPEVVNNNYTIFAVAARRGDEDINMIIGGTSGSANNNLHMGYNNDNFHIAHFGQTDAGTDYIGFAVPGYTSPIFQIHSVIFNHSFGKSYYENGGTPPTATQVVTSLEARTHLAAWPGSGMGRREVDFFNGDIAEIIIFSKALNDQEREDVEAYLSFKYDIPLQN